MADYTPPDINNIEIYINKPTSEIDNNNIIIRFTNIETVDNSFDLNFIFSEKDLLKNLNTNWFIFGDYDSSKIKYDAFTSNNFISIDFKDGKLYASTENGFYIIEPDSNSLMDYYTYHHEGKLKSKLKNKNIVDSNV